MRIIANSLPKSGTHLLMRLLDLFGFYQDRLNLNGSLVRITERSPIRRIIKSRYVSNTTGLPMDMDDLNLKINQSWLEARLKRVPDSHYLPSHLPYDAETEKLLQGMGYKIVFIMRDPRDVVVSYVNHVVKDSSQPLYRYFRSLPRMEDRMSAVLHGCESDGYTLAPLKQRIMHCKGWIESDSVCSISFEHLIGVQGRGDKEKQLKTIIEIEKFLGLSLDEFRRDEIASNIFSREAKTFHKGLKGGWREECTESFQVEMNEVLADDLRLLGYA